MKTPRLLLSLLLLLAGGGRGQAAEPPRPQWNPQTGFWECALTSACQPGPALVQFLLPDAMAQGRKYHVLYILPVEPNNKTEFGHGLEEARKADIANRLGVICVYPTFVRVSPWYGNHATDPAVRQEDYVTEVLVPFVDKTFPVLREKQGRWLIGFSKSAWGAYTLLMKHPGTFGYAAGWDGPFMIDCDGNGADWGPMGLSANFGTRDAMRQNLPTRLARENAPWLRREPPRLILAPGNFWSAQVRKMESLLVELNIPHFYREDWMLPHRWDSGWFAPMVNELARLARTPADASE